MIARAHGKIGHVEIPSAVAARSAEFYRAVFGWTIRTRGDRRTAFDDGVEVSGAFVGGRPAAGDPGFRVYIMVADAEPTLPRIAAHGGEIVEPARLGAPEVVAFFRDSGGNLLGICQERALAGERSPHG